MEEWISELEYRVMKITQTEQKKREREKMNFKISIV